LHDLQEAASRIVAAAHRDHTPRERIDAIDRIDGWIDDEMDDAGEDFGKKPLDEHVLELCEAADLPEALGRRFRTLPRAPRWGEAPSQPYTFEAPFPPDQPQHRDTG